MAEADFGDDDGRQPLTLELASSRPPCKSSWTTTKRSTPWSQATQRLIADRRPRIAKKKAMLCSNGADLTTSTVC